MGLFGKDGSGGRLNYQAQNKQPAGTSALRDVVNQKYVSGDPQAEDRMVRYHLGWKFYRNKHWASDNDKLLSFNFVRAFVDKVNDFLAGKEGFTTKVYDLYGDELDEQKPVEGVEADADPRPLETAFTALVEYIWRFNRKGVLVQEMLQMGGVCGDLFLFIGVKDKEPCVKLRVLDSRTVLPEFEDGDYNRLVAYQVVEPLATNDKKYVQKVTDYRMVDGKCVVRTYFRKSTRRDAEKFNVVTEETDLPWLPIVHIKNHPSSDEWSGTPDTQDVLKLNKVYNELAEDVRRIISYYAAPTTVVTGAVVGDLKRGIDQIWSGLPSDAQVFNLGLGEDLAASTNFLMLLRGALHDFSGVPENTLGKLQAVSNTSGAALHIMYQPLIEAANKKWLSYGAGIEEVNKRAVWLQQKKFPDHELTKRLREANKNQELDVERFFAQPVFTYGLPIDRTIQVNEAVLELTNHFASRKEVMTRLGKKNIPLLEAQIRADRDEDLKYDQALAEATKKPDGEGASGDSGKGTKPAADAEK